MYRSIKTLRGADLTATEAKVKAAASQLVREVSGYRSPSKANEMVFEAAAVADVSTRTRRLLESLVVKPRSGPKGQSVVDPTSGAEGR